MSLDGRSFGKNTRAIVAEKTVRKQEKLFGRENSKHLKSWWRRCTEKYIEKD